MDTVVGIIWLVIGLVVLVPIVGFMLTVAVTAAAMQVALAVAIVGYVAGIPWAIWFRITKGRWPQA